MQKVLFDTNVIIDALGDRPEFGHDAKRLFRLVASDSITGYVCGSSVTDIYYILCKLIGMDRGRYTLGILLEFFTIVNVGGAVCSTAYEMGWADFEDAVVATCAVNVGVDAVITRDKGFKKYGASLPFKVITPHQALRELQ